MPATMTTITAILKEVYEGRIQDQLSEEKVGLKRIEESGEGIVDTVGGKYVTFPIRVTRNTGISYRAENTQLADAGQQGYAAVQVPLKYGYGRFKLTGQVMGLAQENYQAFAAGMDEEMNRLKDDLGKDSNRIAYGNKLGNGVLANITSAATSATQAVSRTDFLEVGMLVDVLVISSGSATGGGTGLTINSVSESALTVTLSASIGATTTGHGFYRAGDRGLEPTGYAQIIAATGALHNVDPATQPLWASNRIHNSGTPTAITELNMIKACDLPRRRGGKISVIFTSLGVRRSYFNLLTQQRRYTDTKAYPGGFQGLPFNYGREIPVVEDPDMIVGTMLFVDESKTKVYKRRSWYFADDDGSILKWVQNFDVWEGMMKQYWELGTSQRNAHTLYEDITES